MGKKTPDRKTMGNISICMIAWNASVDLTRDASSMPSAIKDEEVCGIHTTSYAVIKQ